MSDNQAFDRAMYAWLEAGSDRTPPRAIDAVLLAVKTTAQERDLRIPRRFSQIARSLRVAAAIAIVAVVGVAAVTLVNRSLGPSTGSSPTAAPLPDTLVGTWRLDLNQRDLLTIDARGMTFGVGGQTSKAELNGEVIHLFGASEDCSSDSGDYRWSIIAGILTFNSVAVDPCIWRSDWLNGQTYRPISPGSS